MGKWLSCFKAYDVRGKVPEELNIEVAYNIGRAYADQIGSQSVCVGYDIRLSGPELADALMNGLQDAGVDVIDLGLVGTEMVYFATSHYGYEGGIMITASHNPPEYNGMKMVRSQSRPISSDTGLLEIEKRAFEKKWVRHGKGALLTKNIYSDFKKHLLKFVDPKKLKPLRILANAGNGSAGLAMQILKEELPLQIEPMLFEPDGKFPNGVPNPILEESRKLTLDKISQSHYDFSAAWDGDYDRCFFFDHEGNFIEGYYIVGLLAQSILMKQPGQAIVYDPRLTWNTIDIVQKYQGRPVICKSGHAFIKEKMREVDAVYGGEMSAHHYFRQNAYCDSGMIPFLMVAELLSVTGSTLKELVNDRINLFPCSGEINSHVEDVPATLVQVENLYLEGKVDKIDGLSVEFDQWRFNLRGSNTEPVIRLNVESKQDKNLMEEKTAELLSIINKKLP